MSLRTFLVTIFLILFASTAFASGYGVFTQGASGLGQANAVVAHPTGASSLYFNPALLNDVPGRQVEFGTTAIFSERTIDMETGSRETGKESNFPSTFYYTHNNGERFAAGIGIFFPFGLSNAWDSGYEGRYIGTSGEMSSFNINPAFSYRVTDKLSLAGGLDMVYVSTKLEAKVNQSLILSLDPGTVPDIHQTFDGEGWGHGYNLGLLYKLNDKVSFGATYRSEVNVDIDGDVTFTGMVPDLYIPNSMAATEITLPAQFTAGLAADVADNMTVEVGVRWEDWSSNDSMLLDLEFGQDVLQVRNWHTTWAYNIGANYRLNDKVALNLGYLYGENPVPDATFEPIIPDSDAHLFTIGTDLRYGNWVISGAFGYEHHDKRSKNNKIGDPVGSRVATILNGGDPDDPDDLIAVGTANGQYTTDIFLVGLSIGYKF